MEKRGNSGEFKMNLQILIEGKCGFYVTQIQTSHHKGNEGEEKQRVSTHYGDVRFQYAAVGLCWHTKDKDGKKTRGRSNSSSVLPP